MSAVHCLCQTLFDADTFIRSKRQIVRNALGFHHLCKTSDGRSVLRYIVLTRMHARIRGCTHEQKRRTHPLPFMISVVPVKMHNPASERQEIWIHRNMSFALETLRVESYEACSLDSQEAPHFMDLDCSLSFSQQPISTLAVSHWPFTAEGRVRSQARPCEICGE